VTVVAGLAAVACFRWYAGSGSVPLLLLGLVAAGTAFDFASHIAGSALRNERELLLWWARLNYAALCFGIPFTVLAASFVIAAVKPGGVNAAVAGWYPQILAGSVLFGSLFLLARYRMIEVPGGLAVNLDRSDRFTHVIFLVRRFALGLAVVLCVAVMVEGWSTAWTAWSLAFGLLFIATVPLHILHLQVTSMVIETTTLAVLVYGSRLVFAR
jgi:hypothetical protein